MSLCDGLLLKAIDGVLKKYKSEDSASLDKPGKQPSWNGHQVSSSTDSLSETEEKILKALDPKDDSWHEWCLEVTISRSSLPKAENSRAYSNTDLKAALEELESLLEPQPPQWIRASRRIPDLKPGPLFNMSLNTIQIGRRKFSKDNLG